MIDFTLNKRNIKQKISNQDIPNPISGLTIRSDLKTDNFFSKFKILIKINFGDVAPIEIEINSTYEIKNFQTEKYVENITISAEQRKKQKNINKNEFELDIGLDFITLV